MENMLQQSIFVLFLMVIADVNGFKFGGNKKEAVKQDKKNVPPPVQKNENQLLDFFAKLDDSSKIAIAGGITVIFLLVGAYFLFGKSKRKKYDNEKAFKFVNPRTKTVAPAKSANTKPSSTSTAKAAPSNTKPSALTDTEMRGYKKTADGKTTTYFHRELSEEDKKLLGDSTPKPISPAASNDPTVTAAGAGGVGSAWNGAGTWEEKSYTTWARKHLEELIVGASMNVPVTASGSKDLVRP